MNHQQGSNSAARVRVLHEEETPRGWRYRLAIAHPQGERTHHVELSWVDHDHWSGGSKPPSVVIERLLTLLLELKPGLDLPTRFDAATCRRFEPRLDELLAARL